MTSIPVASHVVEVLRRAESLFGAPGDLPDLTATGHAADAGETVTAAGVGGAAARAHESFRAEAVRRLADTAAADTRLGEQLAEVAAAHATAAAGARRLRENAEAVLRRSGPDAGVVDDVAALRILRAQVAAMQRLVAEQTAGAAEAAARVRELPYTGA